MGLNFLQRLRRMNPVWDDFFRRNLGNASTKGTIKIYSIAVAAAGAQTVTGVRKGDELCAVLYIDTSALGVSIVDSTAEFWTGQGGKIVAQDNTLNNTGGTARTAAAGKQWLIFTIPWEDRL